MSSSWGKRHGLPGYDKLRIGLGKGGKEAYRQVYHMLTTSEKHRYKRRGSVLGFLHEMKMELYERAVNEGYLLTLKGGQHGPEDGTKRSRGRRTRGAAGAHVARDHGGAREDHHHPGASVVRRLADSGGRGSRHKAGALLQAHKAAPDRPRGSRTSSGRSSASRR